jgi:hypothetical protein
LEFFKIGCIHLVEQQIFYNKSIMIKWGTFGQHIWGPYGQFHKKIGNAINFILFHSRLKKIVFASWPNECIPPFFIAMSTLILIFLWNEIPFCFSCGFLCGFFVDSWSVFWELINGYMKFYMRVFFAVLRFFCNDVI